MKLNIAIIILTFIVGIFHCDGVLGKICFLLVFMNIMSTFFGSYIPYAEVIIESTRYAGVGIMVVLGVLHILTIGSGKENKA